MPETPRNLPFPHVLAFDSSAGSGKTHQLALHFLRLLLRPDSAAEGALRSQLCLTFTNAAVKEMADRIISWMKEIILTDGASGKMDQLLAAVPVGEERLGFGTPSRAEAVRSVRALFEQRVLPHFDDLRVSTIDSFIAMLLKAESLRLGLPPDFELTTNVKPRIAAVMDDLFQSILEDEKVRDEFLRFVRQFAFLKGTSLGWSPRDFIEKQVAAVWSFTLHSAPGRTGLEESARHLAVFGEEKEALFRGLASDFRRLSGEIMSACGMPDVRINAYVLNMCRREIREPLDLLRPMKYPEIKLNKGSAPLPDSLVSAWRGFIGRCGSFIRGFSAWYYASLAGIFRLFTDALKLRLGRNASVILMPEIGSLIAGLLSGPDAAGGLSDEIGLYLYGRFRHYLVDEFQDTDRAQWSALSALIAENLSRGGSLFAVGDNKQLIYGWRGADLTLMTDFASGFPQAPFFRSVLSENRRSDGTITRFNNAVFDPELLAAALEPGKLFKTFYASSGQTVDGMKEGLGLVTVTPLPEKETKREMMIRIRDSFRSLVSEILGRRKKSDLCVLCRDNQEAAAVVRWLLEQGIGVESSVTVDIRNNGLVAEILSLLEWFVRPDLDAVFRHFLCGDLFRSRLPGQAEPIRRWCEEILLVSGRGSPMYASFRSDFPAIWEEYFEPFFVRAGYEPAWEFTAGLLNRWDAFSTFPEYAPYFQRLLGVVLSLEDESGSNLSEIAPFFRSAAADPDMFLLESSEGAGADAVKVMTVHKSKGLKFPVVLLPFAGWDPPERDSMVFRRSPEGFGIWHITGAMAEAVPALADIREEAYARTLVEEVNVLYVGFTRPEHELHVFLPSARNWFTPVILGSVVLKDLTIGADGRYRLGAAAPVSPAPASAEPPLPFPVHPPDLSWTGLLKRRLAQPDELAALDPSANLRGDWVHAVLERTGRPDPVRLEGDLLEVLRGCCTVPDAGPERIRLAGEVRRILTTAFRDPGFCSLMDPPEHGLVRTEAEVCDSFGNLFRIDRLVVTDRGILVLDFKTVHDAPAVPDPSHEAQVRRYADIVSAIWPGRTIRTILLYLSPSSVRCVEVSR
jgi:ATP-dependent exoDNAse (exonuclease V) beta subunit